MITGAGGAINYKDLERILITGAGGAIIYKDLERILITGAGGAKDCLSLSCTNVATSGGRP